MILSTAQSSRPHGGRAPEQAFGSDDPWLEYPRANFMWRVKTKDGIDDRDGEVPDRERCTAAGHSRDCRLDLLPDVST